MEDSAVDADPGRNRERSRQRLYDAILSRNDARLLESTERMGRSDIQADTDRFLRSSSSHYQGRVRGYISMTEK